MPVDSGVKLDTEQLLQIKALAKSQPATAYVRRAKLSKDVVHPGHPIQLEVDGEARMTRAVFAAGAPAPEVFDEVTRRGASASCRSASTDPPCGSSREAAP